MRRVVQSVVNLLTTNIKLFSMEESNILKPPTQINLQSLERNKFSKDVKVPCLLVSGELVQKLLPVCKPFLLKLPKFKPLAIMDIEARIYFNPEKISKWEDIPENSRKSLLDEKVTKDNLIFATVSLNYENWNADEIIRAVLPPDCEIVRSYSKVGHLIHLNLRDNLLEYKKIIGQVLLDKTPGVRTVVNKTTKIDNTYRNFPMELICGDDDMITKVKENGRTFEFDFSKVYWNPRLSTEHQRIVDSLEPGDILFDVFCGVGPFAIPCAKKQCHVYANDLNPECHKWLLHNISINKVKEQYIRSFNKDGGDFIRCDVKETLLKLAVNSSFEGKVHVTMNLPALGLDFIVNFNKLFTKNELSRHSLAKVLPTIHVYFFVAGENPEEQAKIDFQEKTKLNIEELELKYHYVRNVSPKKDMVRLSWQPPLHYVWHDDEDDNGEPAIKRPR